jgi:hypothetical protein
MDDVGEGPAGLRGIQGGDDRAQGLPSGLGKEWVVVVGLRPGGFDGDLSSW